MGERRSRRKRRGEDWRAGQKGLPGGLCWVG